MRSRRPEADENHCLVDFLTSEGIFNMLASDFLESRLLRRGQSRADAGTHAVRKARSLTADRSDRLGMTGDGCESFAEILHQLDPGCGGGSGGGGGKFSPQTLEKRRRRRRGHPSFAGSHLSGGPIASLQVIPLRHAQKTVVTATNETSWEVPSPFFTSRFSSAEIKAIGDKNRSAVTWDCMSVGEISSESSSVPIATGLIDVIGLPLDPAFA